MPQSDTDKLVSIANTFALKELPHSEAELSGDIPYEALLPYKAEALTELTKEMELPGFRKGHVPEGMALQRIGEMGLLEEAVNHFIRDFYPILITQKKVDAIARPSIRITKLAPGQPISLVIQTAVYPKISIPKNYKALAAAISKTDSEPVTEEEFLKALDQLQKSRAIKNEDGTEEIPELNDKFAQSIGTFQSLEDLKAKLREGIVEEKARDARDKHRGAIIEALLERTSVDMPEIVIESEIEKTLSQMRADVARFNLEFEEYLKRIEKTEVQLRGELRPSAEKRAKLQLMLNKIAEEEKIEPAQEDVDREFQHALAHLSDADQGALRIHIESVLRNEKVLQMLENKS